MVIEVVDKHDESLQSAAGGARVDSTAVSLVALEAQPAHACAISDALGCKEVIFQPTQVLVGRRRQRR